jgi:hypothetical protein
MRNRPRRSLKGAVAACILLRELTISEQVLAMLFFLFILRAQAVSAAGPSSLRRMGGPRRALSLS